MGRLAIDAIDPHLNIEGRLLREQRGQRDASDFARLIGISKSALYRYERGERVIPFGLKQTLSRDCGDYVRWGLSPPKPAQVVKLGAPSPEGFAESLNKVSEQLAKYGEKVEMAVVDKSDASKNVDRWVREQFVRYGFTDEDIDRGLCALLSDLIQDDLMKTRAAMRIVSWHAAQIGNQRLKTKTQPPPKTP